MMRSAVVVLCVACGASKPAISPQPVAVEAAAHGVTLSYEDSTSGGREAMVKASSEHHLGVLSAAAGTAAYEVHVSLKKVEQTEGLACGVGVAIIALPSQQMVAVLSGDATVEGRDDTALADCIEGVVSNLFETRGVSALKSATAAGTP